MAIGLVSCSEMDKDKAIELVSYKAMYHVHILGKYIWRTQWKNKNINKKQKQKKNV